MSLWITGDHFFSTFRRPLFADFFRLFWTFFIDPKIDAKKKYLYDWYATFPRKMYIFRGNVAYQSYKYFFLASIFGSIKNVQKRRKKSAKRGLRKVEKKWSPVIQSDTFDHWRPLRAGSFPPCLVTTCGPIRRPLGAPAWILSP